MSKQDFDFIFGSWQIHNRRLTRRLVGSQDWQEFGAVSHARPALGGLSNIDEIFESDGTPLGLTLRTFNPATQDWSIYWVGARDGILQTPVVGTFKAGVGTFIGDDQHEGQPCLCRYIWTVTDAEHPRWEQALSVDAGKTWETNWIMDLVRLDRAVQSEESQG